MIHTLLRSPSKLALNAFLLLMLALNLGRFSNFSPQNNEPLDFRQLYAGAQLLATGANPYNDSLLKEQWKSNFSAEELAGLPLPGAEENYLVYPPPVLHSIIPFSQMTWYEARTLLWSLCALAVLLIGLLAAYSQSNKHLLLPLLLLLAFKGTYYALILAQPLLFSLLFILLHFHAERKSRPLLSGFFLALAFLKPSLALPVVFFLLAERKYKSLLYSLGFSSLALILMLLFFGPESVGEQLSGWFHNMNSQMAVAHSPGHDYLRNNLSSLSSWIYSLIGHNLSSFDTFFLLLSSLFVVYLRWKKRIHAVSSLTLLITLSFLFSYHLFYDLLLFSCLLFYVDLSRLPAKYFLPFLALYLPFGYLFPSFNFHPPLLLIMLILVLYPLTLKREPA